MFALLLFNVCYQAIRIKYSVTGMNVFACRNVANCESFNLNVSVTQEEDVVIM